MKLIDETLKTNGKWSIKRLAAFVAFHTAILYEFILPICAVQTKEYVFITLITYSATAIGLTLVGKAVGEFKNKITKKSDDEEVII